jgi:hypothetical protein
MIQSMGPATQVAAGFGSTVWQGSRIGVPVNVVDSRTSEKKDILVASVYADASEPNGVPWPADPRFEGWPGRAWDRKLLIVDAATCQAWELINVQPPWENVWGGILNKWYADRVVRFDLHSNGPLPKGSVTASGLPMLAGMVRFDEVASGDVGHVVTMSAPNIKAGAFVWPALASDGRSTSPDAPPMGTWLRLKPGVDLSALGPQARVVAQALKDHGAIINDTGPGSGISGESDTRWNDNDLATLRTLTLDMFEVVDPSAMRTPAAGFQIR